MFGNSNSYNMEQLYLENGMIANFMLMPSSENGTNKLRSTSGISNGKMKLHVYMCQSCGHIEFKRSY